MYSKIENSFSTRHSPENEIMGLMINDLNLGLSDIRQIVSVWGLCPQRYWRPKRLEIPDAICGKVYYAGDTDIVPGVSIRIARNLSIDHDPSTRWVHIGIQENYDLAIEFMHNVILTTKSGEMAGLWLHPTEI